MEPNQLTGYERENFTRDDGKDDKELEIGVGSRKNQ
jgi:hypothetical protein